MVMRGFGAGTHVEHGENIDLAQVAGQIGASDPRSRDVLRRRIEARRRARKFAAVFACARSSTAPTLDRAPRFGCVPVHAALLVFR